MMKTFASGMRALRGLGAHGAALVGVVLGLGLRPAVAPVRVIRRR